MSRFHRERRMYGPAYRPVKVTFTHWTLAQREALSKLDLHERPPTPTLVRLYHRVLYTITKWWIRATSR